MSQENDAGEGILEEARRITGGERAQNYGHPLPNHQRIADLWNGYLDAKTIQPDGSRGTFPGVTASDVAMMMILLKMARGLGGRDVRDNYVDMAGYARCGARIAGFES